MAPKYGKVLETLLLVGVSAVFLGQVGKNIQLHMAGNTAFSVTSTGLPKTPPLVLCPLPSLDPLKLISFGLTMNSTDFEQAKYDHSSLLGVPDGTSLKQLAEKASWNLGELVKEIRFGQLHEMYHENTTYSPHWRRLYLGAPCYSLEPLMQANATELSVHIRYELQDKTAQYCTKRDKFVTDTSQKCTAAQVRKDFIVYLFIPAISKGYMTRFSVLPKFKPTKIMEYSSYTVQQLRWQGSDNSEECVMSCYLSIKAELGTCFSVQPSEQDLLQKPCSIRKPFNDVDGCAQKCKSGFLEHKWRVINETFAEGPDYIIKVLSDHKFLEENEVYPLHILLSNIGGSLGLFLGISLLALSKVTRNLILCLARCAKKTNLSVLFMCQKHQVILSQLAGFSITLCIIFIAVTHFITSVYETKTLPLGTYVSLDSSYDPIDNYSLHTEMQFDNINSDIISNLVAERIAMRSFGCRMFSVPNSFFECILEKDALNIIGIAPFVYTKDLPFCRNITQDFPKIKFRVPNQMLEDVMNLDGLDSCYKSFKNDSLLDRNSIQLRNGLYEITVFEEAPSFVNLFVEFGGIISLYFGLSLMGSISNIWENGVNLKSLKRPIHIIKLSIRLFLSLFASYVCLKQITNFLFSHPVSIVPLSVTDDNKSAIAFTVCPWPPINTTSLIRDVELGPEAELLLSGNYSLEEREHLLEKLAHTFSQNSSYYYELWNLSQWKITEVLWKYYKDEDYTKIRDDNNEWRTVYIVGHKCFTYTPEENQNYYMIWMRRRISFYLTVHSSDEIPFITDVLQLTSHVHVKKVSKFMSRKNIKNQNFGTCMNKCISEYGTLKLPGMCDENPNTLYNYSEIRKSLDWVFPELPHRKRTFPKLYNSRNLQEKCLILCSTSTKSFINIRTMKIKKEGMIEIVKTVPSFTVTKAHNSPFLIIHSSLNLYSQELVKEYDGYSIYQLISDAGSVIGIILGTSVLSILQAALCVCRRQPMLTVYSQN